MINRVELKNKAKLALSNGNYWMSLAACTLVGIVSMIISGGFSFNMSEEELLRLSPWIIIVFVGLIVINLGINVFLYAPIRTGLNGFFIKSANGETNISNLFDCFKSENYINVVKTIFIRDLRLVGWILIYIALITIAVVVTIVGNNAILGPLLVFLSYFGLIPYIMKYYLYYMTDYIIAENPQMDWRECLDKSKEMMKGCRYELFKLELSFIGWYLLGALCCGIGVMFVEPYYCATITQFYLGRKNTDNVIIKEFNE